ncbi:MAG: hypothetical protein Q8N81_05020, partial [bacterium]|nr:hypothetical protein [bacterium]
TKFQSCQAIFERFALVPALFLAVPALAVGLRFQVPRPVAGDEFGLLGVKNTLSQSLQTDLAKAFPDHAIMPEGVIAPPWKKAHWLVAFGTKFSHSYSRSFLLFLVPKLVSDLRSE